MDGLARSQGSCSDGQRTCSDVNDYAFVFFVSFKTERKKSIRKTYGALCPRDTWEMQMIEKASIRHACFNGVSESCKQEETMHSTLATFCCFCYKR